jgi:hypothetical protein
MSDQSNHQLQHHVSVVSPESSNENHDHADDENKENNYSLHSKSVSVKLGSPVMMQTPSHDGGYKASEYANSAMSMASPLLKSHLKSCQTTYSVFSPNDSFNLGVELLKNQLAASQDSVNNLEKKVILLEAELEEQRSLRSADAVLFHEASSLISMLDNDRLRLQNRLRVAASQASPIAMSTVIDCDCDTDNLSPHRQLIDRLIAVGNNCVPRKCEDDSFLLTPLRSTSKSMNSIDLNDQLTPESKAAILSQENRMLQHKLSVLENELKAADDDIFTARALQDLTAAKKEVTELIEVTL